MAVADTSYFPTAAIDAVSGGFTAGRIIFASDVDTQDDDAALFWDDTNKTLQLNSPTGAATSLLAFKGTKTVASAAGAIWDSIVGDASTLTITGSTNITTATGVNFVALGQPTLSAGSALTVTNASTLYISNAPTGAGAGPATITNAYAIWVDAGVARFDGKTVFGTGDSSRAHHLFVTPGDTAEAFVTTASNVVIGAQSATNTTIAIRDVAANIEGKWNINSGSSTVEIGSVNDVRFLLYQNGNPILDITAGGMQSRIAGTQAAPAWSWVSDDDTGFWNSAANTIGISAGNSSAGSFVAGYYLQTVTATITASTTQTQGQGALTSAINEVSVCANVNDTVTMPAAVAGLVVRIINNGAQTLQIFPASGDAFSGSAVDASITLAAGANTTRAAFNATTWEAF